MPIETAVDLSNLDPLIEKVEFKYTLSKRDAPRVRAMLGSGTTREVYFYDTKDLALKRVNLVLRFRTTAGEKDNSTVKLRPVDLSVDGPALQQIADVEFEADKVGDAFKVAAKIDDKRKAGSADATDVAALFAPQQALLKGHLPQGMDLAAVPVLGPVKALKWELTGFEGFPLDLDVEEWSVEDKLVFLELSCKVERQDAPQADLSFTTLLKRLQLDPNEPQETKTDQVLQFFAARL